jgi:hypothetical protein
MIYQPSSSHSSADKLCNQEYLINPPNNIFKSISDMHARICELLITYVLCDFVDDICAKLELEGAILSFRFMS